MENLPIYISVIFFLTTGLAMLLFYKATHQSKAVIILLSLWLAGQAVLAMAGFYTVTNSFPPRMLLLIVPPLLLIIALFFTSRGKKFMDKLDTKMLTLLHVVRIPVELVLFWLFLNKAVPELMTFEGRNLDILAGLTAPLVYYFGLIKKQLNSKVMLAWNFICLGLLLNIVVHGILSVPTPFQKFGFEQPNIALLYFPFIWLPGLIVPLVLFSHLATVRQIMRKRANLRAVKKFQKRR